MTINDYFDQVFVINLPRRSDRMQEYRNEFAGQIECLGFDGFDHPTSGHCGCTRSHRALLKIVAEGEWDRVLIMEDDTNVITKERLKAAGFGRGNPVWETFHTVLNGEGSFNERFDYLSKFIPARWDVLYLAAGYGEPPISRYNKHVIRCGFMKTTNGYGITREFARRWTDTVDASMGSSDLDRHPGPIDEVFGSMAKDNLYYVFQPRLLYQRKSMSDIEGIETHHLFSQTDSHHESMV